MSTANTCMTSANRYKAPLEDFWAIFNGNEQYTDKDFTTDASSILWTDHGETHLSDLVPNIEWVRASVAFPGHTLWGSEGVTPDDIDQSALGNCYWLAAAASLAEVPGRIEAIFLSKDNAQSPNGIYAVNLHPFGMPHTVIVDDYLPLKKNGDGYRPEFAQMGNDQSIWVAILEKAFAKLHGNYAHLAGGSSNMAMQNIIGGPVGTRDHKQDNATEEDINALFTELQAMDNANHMFTAGSARTDHGMVGGHAYSVLGVHTLSTGARLVKMRNPWGSERYRGDWSRDSALWNEQLKREVDEKGQNDGTFFMSIEDYNWTFRYTSLAFDVSTMHKASFMMIDDATQKLNHGDYSWCGADCVRHELTLYSEVDQKVFLAANTQDGRGVSNDCKPNTGKSNSIFGRLMSSRVYTWRGGNRLLPDFMMKAGESMKIMTEFDFTDPL